MGSCVSSRSRLYQQKDGMSNRSIKAENQTPYTHHGFVHYACGYGFDLNQADIFEIMKKHEVEQRRQKQNDKWETIEQKFQTIKKTYKQHDLDHCLLLIREIQPLLNSIDWKIVEDKNKNKKQITDFLASLKKQHQQMLLFVKEMETDEWQSQGQDDGVYISTRRQGSTVGVRMQKVIQIPVEIFLTVLAEINFYPELIKDIKEANQELVIDRNHKIGYCVYDLPLLSYRQAFFEALGYNRLNHNNSIFMYSRSIHDKPELCQKLEYKPQLHQNYVQIDYKYLIVRYVPIDKKRGKATIAINVDMKINFVPLGIMEFVCKLVGKDFFRLVIAASGKFKGSKWQQKINRSPQTFNFFKKIINEYYQKNANKLQ